jgi:NAD(P)-dependent dehydrogenase (short-subunit alcohol dehydrogenase family)
MTNKNNNAIFITGSSSGLGRATAKLFASRRWKVIATMRDPSKEKELARIIRDFEDKRSLLCYKHVD